MRRWRKNQQIIKTHARHKRRVYLGRHDDQSRFFIFPSRIFIFTWKQDEDDIGGLDVSTINDIDWWVESQSKKMRSFLLVMMNQHWDHLNINMYKVEIARRQASQSRIYSSHNTAIRSSVRRFIRVFSFFLLLFYVFLLAKQRNSRVSMIQSIRPAK